MYFIPVQLHRGSSHGPGARAADNSDYMRFCRIEIHEGVMRGMNFFYCLCICGVGRLGRGETGQKSGTTKPSGLSPPQTNTRAG